MTAQTENSASLDAIALRLKATRKATGLSQVEFATRAGIAKNTYNQYENAVQRPQLEMAIKLCQAHNLTLDWIYRGVPDGLPYALTRSILPENRSA